MHNINPDDLDAIFRDGAENHEYTYNEAAWSKMSAKLDKQNIRRPLWILLSLGVFVVGVLVYWTVWSTKPAISTVLVDAPAQQIENEVQYEKQPATAVKNDIEATAKISSSSEQAAKQSSLRNTPPVSNAKVIANNASTRSLDEKNLSKSVKDGSSVQSIISKDESAKTTPQPTVATYASIPLAVSNNIAERSSTEMISETPINAPAGDLTVAAKSTQGLASLPLRLLPAELNYLGTGTRLDFFASRSDIPPRINKQTQKGYFFGIQAGPEWSSVGLGSTATMGWKLGLNAGISLSDYFELSLGAGISRKKYGSDGSEYAMDGGWVDDIKPMTMESKCYIVDIPVNVGWYPHGRLADGFFAEAGVSSYFFSSEWYGFTYTAEDRALLVANGNEPVEDVLVPEVNRNLVGIANVAIGFQKSLHDGTQLQLTPYLQLPLTGIGSGKVNLVTSGIRMSVKFSR